MTLGEIWSNANTTAKILVFAGVIIFLWLVVFPRFGNHYEPGSLPAGFQALQKAPSVSPSKVIPSEAHPEDYLGESTITIKVPPSDTAREVTVKVLNPKDVDNPPLYSVTPKDSNIIVTGTYSEFSEPIIEFDNRFVLGGGVSLPDVQVSPFGAITPVGFFKTVYIGAAVQRWGFGPTLSWSFDKTRGFELLGGYNLLKFQSGAPNFFVGIGLSFG